MVPMVNSKIYKIVVHCSESPHRGDSAEDIHYWHKARGWDGIGYHYVIREDGKVDYGRPHYWIGAHVHRHNLGTIGICLLGIDYFTEVQLVALRTLIMRLLEEYPDAEVVGHRDLDPNRTCPNFDVKHWLLEDEIRR
jgi:N-acetylmuramoyl-L-alanine amidase